MTVSSFETRPAAHLPRFDELLALATEGTVVFLPDTVDTVGEKVVAGFRPETQELRVDAIDAGLDVELWIPEGATPGTYSEHAADWVLPLLIGMPADIVAMLVAAALERRLAIWRATRSAGRSPTVRYRELVTDTSKGEVKQVEIEGTAEDIIDVLRRRGPTS